MSHETSQHSEKTSLRWVQCDSKRYLAELDLLLVQVSSLIDTSLSIATRLQQYRRYLLEQGLPDLEGT